MENNSGIHSLAGYAYQIKVFVYYSFLLKENEEVSYELFDDVGIKSIQTTELDDYNVKLTDTNKINAVQVKHTSINTEDKNKILYNWILASQNNNIKKYTLFTDSQYNNSFEFDKDKDFFDEIVQSKKGPTALVTKVKNLYKDNYSEFKKIYEKIQNNFNFIIESEMDEKIVDASSFAFRKDYNETVFYQRLHEYMQKITADILDAIIIKKPYVLSYASYVKCVESVCQRLTPTLTLPNYSNFAKIQNINLNDEKILNTREFKQLKSCNLDDKSISNHLIYKLYYEQSRIRYMELDKNNIISDIESLSHDNFCSVKYMLIADHKDTPLGRLINTKDKSNSYAGNDHVKFGSLIYLTSDSIDSEKQISWEDTDNDK